MNNGSLTYQDYLELFKNKKITSSNFSLKQLQPSSIDLTLSEECYQINKSFLSPQNRIRDKLTQIFVKKINLKKKYLFKKNVTYLVRLNEKLNLFNNIFGKCNPKSSTGRLDLFCRTIFNYSDEYETIPLNYKGEMFLEITSRSFNIEFQKGDSLNQMRLIYNKHIYINDNQLLKYHNIKFLSLNNKNQKNIPNIKSGLKISVDLSSKNKISAFVARNDAPILTFQKIHFHKISDFWHSIRSKNDSININKNNFYILKSKEKICIPINMAGEMIPYDTNLGDFRVHYAGFFDPGFGNPDGSYAVFEVKTNEVPFLLEDGQTIARIKYEKLNKKTEVIYGSNIRSNYQNQNLALSKHFV